MTPGTAAQLVRHINGVPQAYIEAMATTAHARTIVPTASTGLGRSSKRAKLPMTKRAAPMAWPFSLYGPEIVLSLAFVTGHPATEQWLAVVPLDRQLACAVRHRRNHTKRDLLHLLAPDSSCVTGTLRGNPVQLSASCL